MIGLISGRCFGHIRLRAATLVRWNQTAGERAVKTWVADFVCGLNLCPFAKDLISSDKLLIKEITGENADDVAAQVMQEILLLQKSIPEGETSVADTRNGADEPSELEESKTVSHESSLLVLPQFKDFDAFLDLVEDVQDFCSEHELSDDIQLATFHPLYRFQGSAASDVSNWTNRSPYAVIHLLRSEDVSRAVDIYKGNTEIIWTRNIKTVEKLGVERLRNMLHLCMQDSSSTTPSALPEKDPPEIPSPAPI